MGGRRWEGGRPTPPTYRPATPSKALPHLTPQLLGASSHRLGSFLRWAWPRAWPLKAVARKQQRWWWCHPHRSDARRHAARRSSAEAWIPKSASRFTTVTPCLPTARRGCMGRLTVSITSKERLHVLLTPSRLGFHCRFECTHSARLQRTLGGGHRGVVRCWHDGKLRIAIPGRARLQPLRTSIEEHLLQNWWFVAVFSRCAKSRFISFYSLIRCCIVRSHTLAYGVLICVYDSYTSTVGQRFNYRLHSSDFS